MQRGVNSFRETRMARPEVRIIPTSNPQETRGAVQRALIGDEGLFYLNLTPWDPLEGVRISLLGVVRLA
ncbi:hypothetical protein EYZ11_009914 [Aspergillus tanneri]|uniref:Uncharacterized protein n=2 Tax=Aspergillus tanneri TaxID=1220188 RepID=A0A4S3J6M7_9EURO|nr:hypothetical protein EYZ11_009914 [Aspergillus tanneri]